MRLGNPAGILKIYFQEMANGLEYRQKIAGK